ncbi:CLUMA_CG002522, isoform A [Clunio marinus]|uniref:THO complex subunit 2 n=1 Tax=Clunio marinus TaxID=568069 RepID=A0A1J1HMU4_9DIPT|nr:CLUMA_CG002522, isoform A [Clunio marinus]
MEPTIYSNWEAKKSEFFKNIKAVIKDDESILLGKKPKGLDVTRAIYDLVCSGIKGILKKDALQTALTELIFIHKDIASIILDIFHVLDTETQSQTDFTVEERSTFGMIIKASEKLFSEKMLKERLEIDTLQEFGIVNKTFYTKFIKIKTKLYYKQRRFNLFREENEGYAKLMTELNKEFGDDDNELNTIEMGKSLIGCFNLDPNRVLDVILESFESRSEQHELFIPLLKSYMPDSNIISEVLGYKYRNYSDEQTPFSLYKVTAILLQHDIIKLDDIYSWLSPVDEKLATEWEMEINDAKEFVRKLNIVSTNKDKQDEEKEPDHDVISEKYATNQKFGLCEALLTIGDWENAEKVMNKLPEKCATSYEPIARALCDLIHIIIEPVYRLKCAIPANIRGKIVSPHSNKKSPPQVTAFVNLRNHAFPMFHALGPSLNYDPVLLQKLLRMMRVILENELNVDAANPPTSAIIDDMKLALYHDIISLLDSCVLPSLSYMECNCCVAEEIWSVVKLYPYNIRYSLYSRWKNESYLVHPKLIRIRGNAEKEIKALMKRVSKENVKPVGRRIGKLTHSSPGFLFDYVLGQIQIYDNLIGPVVDALRFLTSLSYDVLGYCVIEALVSSGRDRFKYGGTSLSDWLQSLANFCGAIYKKYTIELSGLLQYICNQLKAHKSLDLLILKEIVQKMVGIEAAEEMTSEQLSAMCGGELLKGEAGYFSQVRNTKKSSQRLKDALASNDLAVALCLLIAQQKHCVIYRETSKSHLKLVGKLYDQCQDTLVQFGNFLGSTYSVEEYVERLPSIHSMLQEYHIHSDVAFFLARPMLGHAINQKYDQLRKNDSSSKKLTSAQKQEKYLEAVEFVMSPVIESVRPLHPMKVWEDISPQFLVTFWSLSMYDLQTPLESYLREIAKIKQQSALLVHSNDSNNTMSKIKKEQERFQALIEKLQEEKKKQQEHVEKIMGRLNEEKDNWFPSRAQRSVKNETIPKFLQLCLFPRCTFTALDAVYCAKFVHIIHNLKTPNFSTLLCYDRIFCDITCCVTTCTENEATRYGRFLNAMLETVMRWHGDQATFNKECAKFPGFVTKFRVSNQCSDTNDNVGYENFRHVCYKWHFKIAKSIVTCLSSKDYIQIRNAFVILMHIQNHFPVLLRTEQVIQKRVEKVRDEEKNKRQDLHVLASSYLGILKLKCNQLIPESEFHQVSEKALQEEKTMNGDAGKIDKKPLKDRERSEKKLIKVTAEREIKKETPARESSSRDQREPTPREKSVKEIKVKEEKRERETRERDEPEKIAFALFLFLAAALFAVCSPHAADTFEGDLSSVSNSSNGSMHPTADLVIVDDQRESKRRKVEIPSSKKTRWDVPDNSPKLYPNSLQVLLIIDTKNHQHGGLQPWLYPSESETNGNIKSLQKRNDNDDVVEVKKERTSKKEKREKQTEEEKELRKEKKLIKKRDREEPAVVEKRRKDEDKTIKVPHHNGEEDERTRRHVRMNDDVYIRDERHDRDKGHYQKTRTGRSNPY